MPYSEWTRGDGADVAAYADDLVIGVKTQHYTTAQQDGGLFKSLHECMGVFGMPISCNKELLKEAVADFIRSVGSPLLERLFHQQDVYPRSTLIARGDLDESGGTFMQGEQPERLC